MEIQEGDGPFAPTVSRPLRIGETITLVVRGRMPNSRVSTLNADQYNMFVHSCNAVDGTGTVQVELIDRNGYVAIK